MGSCSSSADVVTSETKIPLPVHSVTADFPARDTSTDTIMDQSTTEPLQVALANAAVDLVKGTPTLDGNTDKDTVTLDEKSSSVKEGGEKSSEKSENEKSETEKSAEISTKKKEPMTHEEIVVFKEKTYGYLRQTVEDVMALEDKDKYEGGIFHVKIRNACLRFTQSYFALRQTLSLEEIENYRHGVAEILVSTKFIEILFDIFLKTFRQGWTTEDGSRDDKKYNPLANALLTLVNYSDCSDLVTETMTNFDGFLEMVKTVLEESRNRHLRKVLDLEEKELTTEEEKIMKWGLSMTHNCSMREANIARLRELDFTKVLTPYLQSPMKAYRLNSLASLSGIVNEEECEIINTNQKQVKYLLSTLEKGLTDELRRHNGWSTREMSLTVRFLARCDANKKLLADLGALQLLVKLGKTGDLKEQYESVQAIWALCFDEDNRVKIVSDAELGVVDLLMELKSSNDAGIRNACQGAMWVLRDALKTSSIEKYKDIGIRMETEKMRRQSSKISPTHSVGAAGKKRTSQSRFRSAGGMEEVEEVDEETEEMGHVFISYQWSDQETLKKVRDRIKENGFKVWMDIDQMGGSTLQAMAEAVENAEVVLMCMTQKYKNSPNCRAEAEYAFQKSKKIIPLKLQRGYNPDGWLGFICGAKLYFEFSHKYPFEDKCAALLKEIKKVASKMIDGDGNNEPVIAPVVATKTHSQTPKVVDYVDSSASAPAVTSTVTKVAVPTTTITTVRNWSQADVTSWMEKHSLKGYLPENITGGEVALLISMRCEAPDFFYKYLQDVVKGTNLLAISKIVWALQDVADGK